jgi:hypothetical protein
MCAPTSNVMFKPQFGLGAQFPFLTTLQTPGSYVICRVLRLFVEEPPTRLAVGCIIPNVDVARNNLIRYSLKISKTQTMSSVLPGYHGDDRMQGFLSCNSRFSPAHSSRLMPILVQMKCCSSSMVRKTIKFLILQNRVSLVTIKAARQRQHESSTSGRISAVL